MRIILSTLLIVATAVPSRAWEAEGNPDRHVSFALHGTNGTLEGSGVSTEYLYSLPKDTNVPKEDSTFNTVDIWTISPSMRFPVSHRLTIDMGMTHVNQEYGYVGNLTRFKGRVSGQIYSLGFRYYFPD